MTKKKIRPSQVEYCSLYRAWRYLAFNERPAREEEAEALYPSKNEYRFSQKYIDWIISHEGDPFRYVPDNEIKILKSYRSLKLALLQGKLKLYARKRDKFSESKQSKKFVLEAKLDLFDNSLVTSEKRHKDLYLSVSQLLRLFPNAEGSLNQDSRSSFDYGRYAAVLVAAILEDHVKEDASQDDLVTAVQEISKELWPEQDVPQDTTLKDNLIRAFSRDYKKIVKIIQGIAPVRKARS